MIFLIDGTPRPAGYTLIGTFTQAIKPVGYNDHDWDNRDDRDHSHDVKFDVYRKN